MSFAYWENSGTRSAIDITNRSTSLVHMLQSPPERSMFQHTITIFFNFAQLNKAESFSTESHTPSLLLKLCPTSSQLASLWWRYQLSSTSIQTNLTQTRNYNGAVNGHESHRNYFVCNSWCLQQHFKARQIFNIPGELNSNIANSILFFSLSK